MMESPEGSSYSTAQETCSGGIVVRVAEKDGCDAGDREILMILDKYGFMALPKGHPEPGETLSGAALREVGEETGIKAAIKSPAGTTKYTFSKGSVVVEKTVYYFLMEAVSGQVRPQAGESVSVAWVKEKELPHVKTYPDTLALVKRALIAF